MKRKPLNEVMQALISERSGWFTSNRLKEAIFTELVRYENELLEELKDGENRRY